MRLQVERIKQAILHTVEEVRITAVRHFAESFCNDGSIMPLVSRAIETYGRDSAFRLLRAAEHLVQSSATLDWLANELRREFDPANVQDDNLRFAVALAMLSAPVELLATRKGEIDALVNFPDELRGSLEERLQMSTWTWEQGWKELEEFGRRTLENRGVTRSESRHAERIVESLARHADKSPAVIELLNKAQSRDERLISWLEPQLMQLAGKMRLEAAVPMLLETLGSDDLMFSDVAAKALMRIDGDVVVEAIDDDWWDRDDDFRSAAADVLETIHTELCTATCLEHLDDEDDEHTAIALGHALLSHFAFEAIEPVRELVAGDDNDELSPDLLDLRYHLTAAATIMGITFPEYDVWQREALKTNWGWHDHESGSLADAFRPRAAPSRRAETGVTRTPQENIARALLHSDREVREAALFYFSKHGAPATVKSFVLQAIETLGQDAFPILSATSKLRNIACLVPNDETAPGLIREIERASSSADERQAIYVANLCKALRHADAAVLERHAAAIQALRALDDDTKEIIADRITIDSLAPDALWRELIDFCDDEQELQEPAARELERIEAIVAALARFPEKVQERVLHLLAEDDAGNEWLESLAIRLAGAMRLEAAIPELAARLDECGEWVCEEAIEALARIGGDGVVQAIAKWYVDSDWPFRMAAATTLEDIHTDLSVQTCLDLLEWEVERDLQFQLLRSALMNFSPQAIEPARQLILNTPKDPDVTELRSALLVACQLMNETFPEFEEWLQDSKNDVEFRRQWYVDHPPGAVDEDEDYGDVDLDDEFFGDDGPAAGDFADDDFADDDLAEPVEDEPSITVVRRGERTGRNDPCPCGSGKKFKKCCYGKETFQEETDAGHSEAMSGVRSNRARPRYPVGTVALYGPDAKTTTKMVAGVIKRDGAEAVVERWVGTNVKNNSKVQRQIKEFFDRHGVKSVVAADGNIGCPHEEGLDFPLGEDCPFCPYWAGKQGSNRRD